MTTRTIRLRYDPEHYTRTLDAMRALTGHATELTVDNRRVPPPTDDDPWLTATYDDTRRVGRLLMLPVDSGNSCVVPVFDEEADEFRLRLEHDPANGVFTLFSDALPLAAVCDAGCRWDAVHPAVRSVYSRGAPWSDTLEDMTHLRTLILREADAAWIGGIPRLAGLTYLVVHGPDHLTDLAPFSGLTALEDLTVATGDAQDDLAPLAGLTNLKELQVATSPALADLSPLAGMTRLRALTLTHGAYADIAPLAGMTDMQRLLLWGNPHLADLAPIAGMAELAYYGTSECASLADLTPFAGLAALRVLWLRGCRALTDLSPLAALTELQLLDLSDGEAITDLAPLSGMTRLRDLNLTGCRRLADLSPLAGLAALRILRVKGCAEPVDLTPLEGLAELRVDTRGAREGG